MFARHASCYGPPWCARLREGQALALRAEDSFGQILALRTNKSRPGGLSYRERTVFCHG